MHNFLSECSYRLLRYVPHIIETGTYPCSPYEMNVATAKIILTAWATLKPKTRFQYNSVGKKLRAHLTHYLHLFLWQIQRNTALTSRSIFQIAKETDCRIQQYNRKHRLVQYAKVTAKRFRCFHVILNGYDHAHSFDCKQCGAEKQRIISGRTDCITFGWRSHVIEYIVQNQTQPDECDQIGKCGKRRQ